MGGTPLESDSNSDLIKKISNAYEGGGSSGGGVTVITSTSDDTTEVRTLNIKAGDLLAQMQHGLVCYVDSGDDYVFVGYLFYGDIVDGGGYTFNAIADVLYTFSAATADDYPVSSGGK